MGIDGLLRNIKNCTRKVSLKDYSGKKAAIDTYGWLHKIIKGAAGKDIIEGKNQTRFVQECLKRISKLQSLGIEVIMVFDGGPLQRKAGEQESRKRRRQENQRKGLQLIQEGQHELGRKKLTDAIDITPEVAYQLIIQLKKKGIAYVVAPYEADAQLAYLSRTDQADLVLTEDGDLLVFGAKRVLYKVDYYQFTAQEIVLNDINDFKGEGVCFNWFTHCMFMTVCIMAGCDYLPQIPGIGLKTAHKHIMKVTSLRNALSEIMSTGKSIPQDYEINFVLAFLTFRFQRVYCPRLKKCVEINDMSILNMGIQDLERLKPKNWSEEVIDAYILQYVKSREFNWDFLGPKLDDDRAQSIAEGLLHPITGRSYTLDPFSDVNYSQHIFQARKKKPNHTHNMVTENRTMLDYMNKNGSDDYNLLNDNDQDSRSQHFEQQFKINRIQPRPSIQRRTKTSLKINENEDGNENQQEQCKSNEDSGVIDMDAQEAPNKISNSPITGIGVDNSTLKEEIKVSQSETKNEFSYKIDFRLLQRAKIHPKMEVQDKHEVSIFLRAEKMFEPPFDEEFLRSPFRTTIARWPQLR